MFIYKCIYMCIYVCISIYNTCIYEVPSISFHFRFKRTATAGIGIYPTKA